MQYSFLKVRFWWAYFGAPFLLHSNISELFQTTLDNMSQIGPLNLLTLKLHLYKTGFMIGYFFMIMALS